MIMFRNLASVTPTFSNQSDMLIISRELRTKLLMIKLTIILPVSASSPANVSAEANSSTSIAVTWDILSPVAMYQVRYEPLETFGGVIGSQVVNVSGGVKSTLLVDLQENINYSISVQSFTSTGGSAYSQEVVAATFEDGKHHYGSYRENR